MHVTPSLIGHGLTHKVGRVLSLFSNRRNCDCPTPLAEASVPPTLCCGGRAHSLAGKGLGESQFRRGDIHCGVLCGLTYTFAWYGSKTSDDLFKFFIKKFTFVGRPKPAELYQKKYSFRILSLFKEFKRKRLSCMNCYGFVAYFQPVIISTYGYGASIGKKSLVAWIVTILMHISGSGQHKQGSAGGEKSLVAWIVKIFLIISGSGQHIRGSAGSEKALLHELLQFCWLFQAVDSTYGQCWWRESLVAWIVAILLIILGCGQHVQ